MAWALMREVEKLEMLRRQFYEIQFKAARQSYCEAASGLHPVQ
jgi:hypothetical protein